MALDQRERGRSGRSASRALGDKAETDAPIDVSELSDHLGYQLKRAQLRLFEDFLTCVAPLKITPAQFSVLVVVDANPGRNQTEIATALGILRPNFVAMLDTLERRGLCARARSSSDRRSHALSLTDKGRATLASARKRIASGHEGRLGALFTPRERTAFVGMLSRLAKEL